MSDIYYFQAKKEKNNCHFAALERVVIVSSPILFPFIVVFFLLLLIPFQMLWELVFPSTKYFNESFRDSSVHTFSFDRMCATIPPDDVVVVPVSWPLLPGPTEPTKDRLPTLWRTRRH